MLNKYQQLISIYKKFKVQHFFLLTIHIIFKKLYFTKGDESQSWNPCFMQTKMVYVNDLVFLTWNKSLKRDTQSLIHKLEQKMIK